MVEELSSYTPQDLADLDTLMHELSATSFCNEEAFEECQCNTKSEGGGLRVEDMRA